MPVQSLPCKVLGYPPYQEVCCHLTGCKNPMQPVLALRPQRLVIYPQPIILPCPYFYSNSLQPLFRRLSCPSSTCAPRNFVTFRIALDIGETGLLDITLFGVRGGSWRSNNFASFGLRLGIQISLYELNAEARFAHTLMRRLDQ